MKLSSITLAISLAALSLTGCNKQPEKQTQMTPEKSASTLQAVDEYKNKFDIYTPVALTADLSTLSDDQKRMVGLLIDASKIMDDLFWKQSFGEDKAEFLARISDPDARRFAEVNYGPWDRLNGDKPFLTGFGEKPLGAQFYPADMTKKQLTDAVLQDGEGLYSVITRNEDGKLQAVKYSVIYQKELKQAADILVQASKLAEDSEFANYLKMRAEALLNDDYQASDFAWMNMKNNAIELVYGPIETYEDQLFGYRAGFESYVLIKDLAWSEKLEKYAKTLPELQKGLPVPGKYKKEVPGANSQLNAYDVVYYAGHSNAGGKTIAINLPNDEQVQLQKGTRRLQLKNAMKAKFDKILLPISDVLIAPEQRKHITFNAFFNNTMFHEVAHGLGIKNTITGTGTVRQSLQEHASALEEGKADILGLYMITQLFNQGVITEGKLEDYYTTFLAGIFRSVRFGASSAHGKANMIRFNYFADKDAFQRDENGLYRVDMVKMQQAMTGLSTLILTLQGDGDYDGVDKLVATSGIIKPQLAADLARLTTANIPVDIVFEQGKEVLGL
ncbi:Zn-dependent hydrolase [Psychrosphaera sp. 1_MG-2023]|uniref:dipeptidyl-peptidase 3 family protein n=1 Tax=Psychrosphaera sp. 1_MG-2023 TaxID=3062643 RepID=UPI0026E31264|nr:Zn-dependent hydrolase [Psychrosphaera sp. 1_MG-2023]MDO6718442.1 Zn-dependent hydrolase [Psychrosphaera sp. 1_MG-2023]